MENLIKVQQELKAPKGQFNNFGKYKYRSCEDILEAVKPVLEKYKSQLTISDEIVEIGGRVYVKATATFRSGSEVESVSAFAREPESKKGMDESQITGAASSYARKYALNGLFLIDDTKDADATNDHSDRHQYKKETKATDPYVEDEILPEPEKKYYLEHPSLSKEQKTYLIGHNLTESLKYKIDEQIAGAAAGQKEIIY